MNAKLVMNGWAGRTETPVQIIYETPTKYCILLVQDTQLAGCSRWGKAGETVMVPKYAIKREQV